MTTKLQQKKVLAIATTALVGVVVAGCGGGGNDASNDLPTGIKQLGTTVYPAIAVGTGATAATQDLLTAGMGRTGLGAAAPPAYADPLNPTALELRRNAIFPTTAAFWIRALMAATAACMAPTSLLLAWSRPTKG